MIYSSHSTISTLSPSSYPRPPPARPKTQTRQISSPSQYISAYTPTPSYPSPTKPSSYSLSSTYNSLHKHSQMSPGTTTTSMSYMESPTHLLSISTVYDKLTPTYNPSNTSKPLAELSSHLAEALIHIVLLISKLSPAFLLSFIPLLAADIVFYTPHCNYYSFDVTDNYYSFIQSICLSFEN